MRSRGAEGKEQAGRTAYSRTSHSRIFPTFQSGCKSGPVHHVSKPRGASRGPAAKAAITLLMITRPGIGWGETSGTSRRDREQTFENPPVREHSTGVTAAVMTRLSPRRPASFHPPVVF